VQITASQPNGYAVRLWGRFRDAVRARRAIVRSASLTARVSGNISATSGSRRTTLVPSAYRAAVMPRTAFEKSYSGRIVSSSDPGDRALPLFFFIYGVGSCITTMCDCKTGSRLPQSGRGYSSDTKQKTPTSASTPIGITGSAWRTIGSTAAGPHGFTTNIQAESDSLLATILPKPGRRAQPEVSALLPLRPQLALAKT